jgi:hypothetical protein
VAAGQYLDGHVIGPGGAQLIDAHAGWHSGVTEQFGLAKPPHAASAKNRGHKRSVGPRPTQAARLLMANRPNDITGVGHRFGYDSPSQFSRTPLYR